jgi:hypothetical protein
MQCGTREREGTTGEHTRRLVGWRDLGSRLGLCGRTVRDSYTDTAFPSPYRAPLTGWSPEASLSAAAIAPDRPAGPPPLSLPAQQELSALLDWQLWYWGQDIHHLAGNALLRFGFQRVRGPADRTQRSSAYELTGAAGGTHDLHGLDTLVAWGFAVSASHAQFARQHGHLLLVRHEQAPGLCPTPIPAQAGTRELLPARTIPRSTCEWHCLCATIVAVGRCCAGYERWSRHELGASHRRDAHRQRPRAVRRRHPQPMFLDEAWYRLADRIERDATPSDLRVRAAS